MNLQAKLTLGAVALEVLIVGAISVENLASYTELAFTNVLSRAKSVSTTAANAVTTALNANPRLGVTEALAAASMTRQLTDLMTEDPDLIEILVADPTNKIVADNDPERDGLILSTPYPDFEKYVNEPGWSHKLALLSTRETGLYQLEKLLGANDQPVVFVRVLVKPSFIRNQLGPTLRDEANFSLISFAGAVAVTFLISTLAFRRVGRLNRMLDLVASGEYQPPQEPSRKSDEFAAIESKVGLLSQRLRGAELEVSGLRGNIDGLLAELEDAVFVFNRDRRLVFASPSVEKYVGAGRAGLLGHPLGEVFPASEPSGELIAHAADAGQPLRGCRTALPPQNGAPPRRVVLSIDMLETSPGVATGGFLVRLRDPEAQRKIGQELQMADRLAAMSQVTGGVAHEVKNPLNAMLLHLEVAKSKLNRGETEVSSEMEIISKEILRLDRVVKTFLDFNRPVELRRVLEPAEKLVEEIADLARPQAEAAQIAVTVKSHTNGAEIFTDRDLLKQALLNIAINAIQAMPEGGELLFESALSGDFVEIRIADTGAGIPPEVRDKIFRLYFTTKNGGSGIGLAMTFRIVQLHDGTISFASEPGKGTTFLIRLPVAA